MGVDSGMKNSQRITIALLLSKFFGLSLSASLKSVTIAGYFSAFSYGQDRIPVLNHQQCQHFAAFMMAMDEINNKTDGVFDSVLDTASAEMAISPGQYLDKSYPPNPYFDGASAVYEVKKYCPTLIGCVETSTNLAQASASASASNSFGIVSVLSNSPSSTFNDVNSFPMNLQIAATTFSEAAQIADLISSAKKWQRVVLFTDTGVSSIDSYAAFAMANTLKKLTIIGEYFFDTGDNDYTERIVSAKRGGGKIFIFFLDGTTAGRLLEQGYNAGLFHDGTQVLATSTSNIDDIKRAFTTAGRLNEANILKGFISTAPHPEYHFSTPQGQGFVSRFRKLSPTIVVDPVTKIASCNTRKDASPGNSSYMYQTDASSGINGIKTGPVCLGFQSFEAFNQNGSNIDPYTMFVYDGVYDLVSGIDALLKEENSLSSRQYIDSNSEGESTSNAHFEFSSSIYKNITATDLHNWMTSVTTKFPTRVTGNVSFLGLGGSRTVGNVVKILNYRAEQSTNDYSKGGLAFVGLYTDTTGWLLCNSKEDKAQMPLYGQGQCSLPLYRNTPPNIFPPDSLPDIIAILPSSYKISLNVFAVIGLLLLSMYVAYVLLHWSEKSIKRSQPVLHLIIFLGSFFGLVKVLLSTSVINRSNCVTQLWFEHLAYRLVLRTILLKLWRVHVIVNSSAKTVRRVVGLKTVLIYILVDLIIVCSLLVAVTYTTSSHYNSLHGLTVEKNNNLVGTEKSYERNQFTVELFCCSPSVLSVAFIFYTTLLAFEGLYLLLIAYYIYLSRDLPSTIQAAGIAGKGIYCQSFIVSQ